MRKRTGESGYYVPKEEQWQLGAETGLESESAGNRMGEFLVPFSLPYFLCR